MHHSPISFVFHANFSSIINRHRTSDETACTALTDGQRNFFWPQLSLLLLPRSFFLELARDRLRRNSLLDSWQSGIYIGVLIGHRTRITKGPHSSATRGI
jgi:hypothetical protein